MTLRRLLRKAYVSNPEKAKAASRKAYVSNPEKAKAASREAYVSNPEKAKAASRKAYVSNPEKSKAASREAYASNPEKSKAASREAYASNPEKSKAASRKAYVSNTEKSKAASREAYASNPEKAKAASKHAYTSSSDKLKASFRKHYETNSEKRKAYFKLSYEANCVQRKAAAKKAYRESPEGKKNASRQSVSGGRVAERKCASNKVYYNKNDWKIKRAQKSVYKAKKTLLCVNRRGRYALREQNVIEYHKCLNLLKEKMHSKTYQQVRVEFCKAFQQKHSDVTEAMSSNDLASTVCRIACQDLLSRALKLRKTVAGKLLKCVRTVNSIELAAHNLGEKYLRASSEPFFTKPHTHQLGRTV